MNSKAKLISDLNNIYDIICEVLKEGKKITENCKQLEILNNTDVIAEYDKEHKDQYIISKIGAEPVKPLLIGKKKYEEAHKVWLEKKEKTEFDYESESAAEKNQLLENYKNDIKQLNKSIEESNETLKELKVKIDSIDTKLSDKLLKQPEKIKRLIEILEEGRADTLKEALNILYEELDKEEMKNKIDQIQDQFKNVYNSIDNLKNELNDSISETNKKINDMDYRLDRISRDTDELSVRLSGLES